MRLFFIFFVVCNFGGSSGQVPSDGRVVAPKEWCEAFQKTIEAIRWTDDRTSDLHLHLASLRVPEDIRMFHRHLGCDEDTAS